ncbi:tetratricopeptide repeat protein [Pseudoluteimonas lycopersici]|uniref:Ancillary SecYEG translocon subunit n=1 Tax=Pseudoluteimonas lycopersici TaxID=1324796 RepID=A0A516V325_9GAMM|nr:tetratricopeptide repeat protein [Lysobacter lycopersici]QDQ72926.1 tetratricopeptide repeat protein [Lysobacter lycopersici]
MAIDELLDEHEQSERVRRWVRENALGLVGGVVLGLALVGGWKWWQGHQQVQREAEAAKYEALQGQIKAQDLAKAKATAASLQQGPYATLVALDLAKAQAMSGKRDDAIATLRAVKPGDALLAGVVRERLARLLLDAGKADEALRMLSDAGDPAGLGARGDAHLALGHRDQARSDYDKALALTTVGSPMRRVLELKLSEVGGASAQAKAGS